MWKLRSVLIIFALSLFFIPYANAEEELIVEFDTNLEPNSYDYMGFQAKARQRCRIELTSNQSVYAVVAESMGIEQFDSVFSGQTTQFDYVETSKSTLRSGGNTSNEFRLPQIKEEDELYYENYYFVIVGYGPYPFGWCEGGDDPAHVNVKIYKLDEESSYPCCSSVMIFIPMGLLGVIILLNVKKRAG